jgi:isoquinoline 1-oxidoreductase beta subunit
VDALMVTWSSGTNEGKSDATVLAELRKAELLFLVPDLPLLIRTVDHEFVFSFASNSPLETNCAVADVTADRAEI